MYSSDFRWRDVALHHAYAVSCEQVARIFGVSGRAVRRWYELFKTSGDMKPATRVESVVCNPRYAVVCAQLHKAAPVLLRRGTAAAAASALWRGVQRSVTIEHAALQFAAVKEGAGAASERSNPARGGQVFVEMRCFYTSPEQLLFLDETSKNGLDSVRRRMWSRQGTKAVVTVPFARDLRISILVACGVRGFIAWETTGGTFTRRSFHMAFVNQVVKLLNPWPVPRSIIVMDNAHIHMYAELEQSIHRCGATLISLSPYSPQLNPIEVMFSQLKRWVERYVNLVFPLYPELVLKIAMKECVEADDTTQPVTWRTRVTQHSTQSEEACGEHLPQGLVTWRICNTFAILLPVLTEQCR